MFGKEYKLWSSSLCSLLQSPVTLFLLGHEPLHILRKLSWLGMILFEGWEHDIWLPWIIATSLQCSHIGSRVQIHRSLRRPCGFLVYLPTFFSAPTYRRMERCRWWGWDKFHRTIQYIRSWAEENYREFYEFCRPPGWESNHGPHEYNVRLRISTSVYATWTVEEKLLNALRISQLTFCAIYI
jgi:hypothetical protein